MKPPVWERVRSIHTLKRGHIKVGYVQNDGVKWIAVVFDRGPAVHADTADHETRREAMAWVEERTR